MGIAISQPKMGNQGAICQEFPNHMIVQNSRDINLGFPGRFENHWQERQGRDGAT
jgi:hypothetical protein